MRFTIPVLIALVLGASAAPAWSQTAVDRGGRNLFSRDQDVELGRQAAAQAEAQYPILRDAVVQRYVADVGARLARHAPGHDFPYTFKVVDIGDINAFALPGGPVYINRGIIEQARTEGEMAGVIAHEISHVDLRHGTRQATKAYGAQIGLSILGSLIGSGDATRQIINMVGGFSLNSVLLKYSREAETDADILGSQILAAAGYDPREMATFFELLEAQSPRRTKEFFSSHPAPDRRRERITHEAALLGATTRTVPQDQFRGIQSRLRSLPPAPTMEQHAAGQRAPQQGGTTDTTLPARPGRVESPSRRLVWYEGHRRIFRVAHPDNWRVISQSDGGVTIAPEGGAYSTSRGIEVTHGVLVNVHQVGRSASLDAVTDQFVAEIRRSSPYLRAVSGSRRDVVVDGGRGVLLSLIGAPSSGRQRERVDVVTRLMSGDRLVAMLFVSPDDAPREYEHLLEAMIRNFRVAGR